MLPTFERMVALRYLRPQRAEGFISVVAWFSLIGIALGVATLIVVMSVMSGVEKELTSRIIGMKSHVTLSSPHGGLADYDKLAVRLMAVDGVASAIPVVEGQAMVSTERVAQGALISGIRATDLARKKLVTQHIVAGSLKAFGADDGVLIGSRMARKLGVTVGDAITLISPEGRATIAGVMPRIQSYPVAGIFDVGMYEYDAALILMPFRPAQIFFKLKDDASPGYAGRDEASSLEIGAQDPREAPELAHRIVEEVTGGAYEVQSWQESSQSLFAALQMQRNLMVLVLALIVLVASFNLISSLIMLVRSKRRDIAILRTIGAPRERVLRIFVLAGTAIGALGTGLGVVLGLLVAANIAAIQTFIEHLTGTQLFADQLYFFTTLPSDIHGSDVAAVAIAALLLSFLATLYPAWRAGTLDPAEALRYE